LTPVGRECGYYGFEVWRASFNWFSARPNIDIVRFYETDISEFDR
jgi:hypothetical protein